MNTTYRMLLVLSVVLAWFVPTAHARWYDPTTGRWLERDPMTFIEGSNLYQYNRSKPVVLVDPLGLKSCCGPDVSGWFAKELNIHSSFWAGWSGGPALRPAYFFQYAKTIPYKWMDFGSDCPDKQGEGCQGTVSLCGTCIDKSDLGNIMFGAMGKQWVRGEALVIGAGRKAGGTGGIDSPEDLASVLAGILMSGTGTTLLYTDLQHASSSQMCSMLKADYSSEIGKIRTALDDSWEAIYGQVDKANLMNTIGKKKAGCGDCGAGAYDGGHSDFSPVGNDRRNLAAGWQEKKLHRDIYKGLPITWPGDPAKDPCACKEGNK